MAISVIIITVAVPSFSSFIRNGQLATQSNDLMTALNLARSEAIKRNNRISVCASSNGSTCASSTNWATGWLVFLDETGTTGVLDGTDELLKAHEALDGSTTLTSSSSSAVTFVSTGYKSDYDDSSPTTITFTLSHPSCSGEQKRTITITPFGRIELVRESC